MAAFKTPERKIGTQCCDCTDYFIPKGVGDVVIQRCSSASFRAPGRSQGKHENETITSEIINPPGIVSLMTQQLRGRFSQTPRFGKQNRQNDDVCDIEMFKPEPKQARPSQCFASSSPRFAQKQRDEPIDCYVPPSFVDEILRR